MGFCALMGAFLWIGGRKKSGNLLCFLATHNKSIFLKAVRKFRLGIRPFCFFSN